MFEESNDTATFVICISGFTQHRGYAHGILKLREKLISAGHSEGLNHRVWYMPWYTDFEHVVDDILFSTTNIGKIPKVLIAGYSYGGWGSLQLARILERHGIDVDTMILSDPVGRPLSFLRSVPILNRLPAPLSLLGRDWAPSLKVPASVKEVYEFHQQEKWHRPQGHRLIPTNGTLMHPPVTVSKRHQQMDDLPGFHQQVLMSARKLNS